MLKELLNDDTVQINVEAKDWEDAVIFGGKLLENVNLIEHRYIDAMIDTVKKIGPYIVIAPGIAMPHARPEAGAKGIGMALITLKDSVNFGNEENDPVKIVIFLCAVDNNSHIQVLSELMELIQNEKFIKIANNAKSKKEILNYINNKEYTNKG